MKLQNEFFVDVPAEEAWPVLLDLERVAKCLPGVTAEPGGEPGVYRGRMKMKLGPMVVEYRGTARFGAIDEAARTATIEVVAREREGQGTASAMIVNRVESEGSKTRVIVDTDLRITGRQAQFGRGIMQDISERMLGDFATRFERELLGERLATDMPLASAFASSVFPPRPEMKPSTPGPADEEMDALDVGRFIGGWVTQYTTLGVAALALFALGILLRHRHARRGVRVEFAYSL